MSSSGDRPAFRHEGARHGLIGPFTGRQLAIAAAVVAAAGIAFAAVTAPIAAPSPALVPPDAAPTQYAIGSAGPGLHPGSRPPELLVAGPGGTRIAARGLDGRPVSLAALRGRVVWIDFWASWCPPCRAETPTLRDLYARYHERGLEIVAISVQESTTDDVRAYAERYGLGYPIVADLTGEMFRAWGIYGLPTQLFLDRDGVLRRVIQGPVDAATGASLIESLLGPGPGPSGSGSASPSPAASGSSTPPPSPQT